MQNTRIKVFGGNDRKDTPVPIPNTEVKLSSADDTWREASWESRSPPDLYEEHHVICVVFFLAFAKNGAFLK